MATPEEEGDFGTLEVEKNNALSELSIIFKNDRSKLTLKTQS